MKKNFTQFISEVSKARQFTFATITLLLLIISAAYLRAAVGITVTGGSTLSMSADLAADATLSTPGYTTIGDFAIIENVANDISSTGSIILTAPAGWRFSTTGVTAVGGAAPGETRGNIRITVGTPTVSPDGLQITIPITNHTIDRLEQITISGIRVQALNGTNIPGTGNIIVSASNGTSINGLPTSVPKAISQTSGNARKLTFGVQPTVTTINSTISPAPTVLVQDQFGNTVTGSTSPVTVAIGNNPAGSNGVLGGTKTVNAVSGVATFSSLFFDAAGTGYTLTASSGTLTAATSSEFNITNQKPTVNAPTNCITEGASNTPITLTGTNFDKNAVVEVNGTNRTTTYTSSTQLQVTLLTSDLASDGDLIIRVINPGPPSPQASDPVILSIRPRLASEDIVGERIVCAGNEILYTAPTGYTGYNWTSSAGSEVLQPTENPSIVRFFPVRPASGTVTISLSATNSCGVTSTTSFNVQVKPTPQAIIERSSESFCVGGTLELSAFINPSELDSYSYAWFKLNGDGISYDPIGDEPTYTVTAAGTYRLTVTGANGCADTSDPLEITVNPLPVATITATGNTTFCKGGSVVLTANEGASYLWSTGETTRAIVVEDPGNYKVKVTDEKGCTSLESSAVTVTVNPLPTASIQASGSNTFCEGGSVTLTAQGGTSWLWSNGATTQSIIVDASGTFSVRVTDGNSCTSSPSAAVTVTENPLPTVSITTNLAAEYCSSDQAIPLAGSPSGTGGSFRILKNETEVAIGASFNPSALGAGTYRIEYSYTDDNTCTNTATKTVVVKQQPTVTVTSDLEICAGGSATLTASGAETYTWSPATGLSATTGASITANPTATTTYTVIGTTDGCQSVAKTVTVTVNPLPTATVTVTGPTEFCAGSSITLNAPEAPAGSTYVYDWTFTNDQGIESKSSGKTLSVSESGSAVVKVTNIVTGCEKISNSVELRRGTLEFAIFSYSGSTTFCQGQELKLTAIQAPEGQTYEYRWLLDNGTATPTVVSTAREFIAKDAGVYRVEITETSIVPYCVKTSDPIQIIVNPLPTADAGSDETKCFTTGGTVFTLNGTVTNGTGVWSVVPGSQTGTAAASIANPNAVNSTVSLTGTGSITLRLTANSNATPACTNDADEVTLTVNPLPSATITEAGPTTFCQNGSVVLSAPMGNYSYQWYNKGVAINGAINQQYTASVAGDYTVSVTDNATTCAATTATPTKVTVNPQPVVSAASSPDPDKCVGDGGKTVFSLTGSVTNGTPKWSVVGTTGDATVATNDIESPNATSTNVTVSGVGTVTMRLTASSSVESCSDAYKEITLTVYPMPIANAGQDQELCQATSGPTYFWRDGSGSGAGSDQSLDVRWSLKSKDEGISSVGIGYEWQYKQRVDIVGVGSVTLTMTVTANGCSTSDDVIYTVKPRPVVTAIDNKTYCNGAAVQAIGLGSNIASEYTWTSNRNIGFGTSGNGSIPAFEATNTGAAPVVATITVTATADGCAGPQQSFTITVNPTPKLSSTLAPAAVCSGNQFNYTPTSATAGATFAWSRAAVGGNAAANGDGSISEILTNTSTAPITVTYVITTSANGCTGETQNVVVTVNPRPVLSSLLTATVCSGTLFTYTPSSATTGTTFSWTRAAVAGISNGEVTTPRSGGISETLVNTTAAPVNVTYVYTSTANGCAGESQNLVVTVNPKPVLSSTLSPAAICSGITFIYTPISQTGNFSFTWTRLAATGITSTGGTSGSGPNPISQELTNTTANPVNVTYRIVLSANGCNGSSQDVVVTVNPAPRLSSSLTPTAVCSGSAFNYTATSATANTTFSWSRAAVAGISNQAVSDVAGNVINETLTNTTANAIDVVYAVRMTANGCINTQNVTVKVNPNLPVSFTGAIASTNVFYTGQSPIVLSATPTGGTFSGKGVSGSVSSGFTFNPCTAGAGEHTITYTRTTGTCTSVITRAVTVRQSTYRAVITANPHPFCRGGGGTTYTAAVYRDVQPGEIIYPYLVDANGNPVDAAGNPIPKGGGNYPVPNPDYPYPANTPQSIKDMAYRFFQPIVSSALEARKIDQNLFTYQWGKNDEVNRKNDLYITKDAGLSSQDYYEVEVLSGSLCGPVTLESNRMYSAVLDNYVITLTASPNPICQGAAVTFNGTLGVGFPWAIANLQLKVVHVRTNTVLYSSGYTGNTFQFTTDGASFGGFINGDRVEVQFTSNITGYLPSSNCIEGPIANSVVINVNDIVAGNPTDQSQTICLNGSATFTAPATTTGPATVTYTWKIGDITYTTTTPTLNVTTPRTATAGAYPVSVVISNGCETTSTLSLGTLTVKPALSVYNLTGNAQYCVGATGTFLVTLSGSQTGVNYTLTGGTTTQTLAGTGGVLVFNVPKSVATYTIQAAYATAPACTTPMNGSAVISENPLPTVTVNSPTICAGQTATVTAVPANGTGPYTYTWTVPTSWSGNIPTTASFQTTVAGTYTVKVADDKSCVSSEAATSTVTINPLPTVTVNSPQTCKGSPVRVIATVENGTGPYTYAWTVPAGVSDPGSVASFETAVSGTYSVVVTDDKRCASVSASGTVSAKDPIIANGFVTADKDPIKMNEPVTFTVTHEVNPADVRLISWYLRSLGSTDWGTSVGAGNQYTMTPTTDEPFEIRAVVTTSPEVCYSFTEYFMNSPITPLPVELIYFKAVRRDNTAVLTWATASEINNEGFEVQVSQDGVNYRQLQFVASKNGNTSIKQTYEFVDKENGKFGTRYYRLRQLDSDGQYAYYGPQMVIFGDVSNSVFVYPNPFEREVKLDVDSEKDAVMEVTLTNLMGRKLLTRSIEVAKGRSSAALNLGEGLPAGIYIVTTRLNGITTNFKLMKK